MKAMVCSVAGAIGGIICAALGGWDFSVKALLACMIIDYASGWAVAAGFHKSSKTSTGAYSSNISLKGLTRKAMMFAIVCVGNLMDGILGVNYLRDAIVIGFTVNEILSITENAGLMGLPLPKAVVKAMDVLANKADVVPGITNIHESVAVEDMTDNQIRTVLELLGLSRTYTEGLARNQLIEELEKLADTDN